MQDYFQRKDAKNAKAQRQTIKTFFASLHLGVFALKNRISMLKITQAETVGEIAEARLLFREYETWLGMSLCFQDFENEVASLPGKYAMPHGRLLLAHDDDKLAGCIALRKLEDGICEMKRLYVRGGFRGKQIGLKLIERLIADARDTGYERMRLDTYPPKMGKAVKLYESHGFVSIPAYYHNPHEGVLFMELTL
jgi:putative acetyltransferase